MKEGHQGTGIAPEALQDTLDASTNGGAKGQSQFPTPLWFARLVTEPLTQLRGTIVDLTSGNGQLLIGAANSSTRTLLGVDVDPVRTLSNERELSVTKIVADICKAGQLLDEVNWRADLFVLNPPFDCHWSKDALKFLETCEVPQVRLSYRHEDLRLPKGRIDSTVATLAMAIHFMSDRGEGVMIGNADTLDRLIMNSGAPHKFLADHVWHYAKLKGNPMTGSDTGNFGAQLTTGIIWFAKAHCRGCGPAGAGLKGVFDGDGNRNVEIHEDSESLTNSLKGIRHRRIGPVIGVPTNYCEDTRRLFNAVKEEYGPRFNGAQSHYNIWLEAGKIKTHLSLFEERSVKIDKAKAVALHTLNGQSPMQLVMQRAQRTELLNTVNGGVWKVDPNLPIQIDECIAEYNSVRAPLYTLSDVQRLGYLDESDMIRCKKDMFDPKTKMLLFCEGLDYPIRTQSITVQRIIWKSNPVGVMNEFLRTGHELAIFIKSSAGDERAFMDARLLRQKGVTVEDVKVDFVLSELIETFDIPEVPDVAACKPKPFAAVKENLQAIEDFVAKLN